MHTPCFAAQVERALGTAAEELATTGNPGAAFAHAIVRAIPASQHFTLPAGGRLFDDGLRGLDTDLRTTNLDLEDRRKAAQSPECASGELLCSFRFANSGGPAEQK